MHDGNVRHGDAGTGSVDSWNGRTGSVNPAASDYDASQVDNDSGVTGSTVAAALDQLDAEKLSDLEDDASPQLGGPLEANGNQVRCSKGADVASAAALTLGADGNSFDITGTNAIASIGTLGAGTIVLLQFDDVLTLTHHATALILPGAANITTAAGDIAIMWEYSTGNWQCVSYLRSDGSDLTITTATTSAEGVVELATAAEFRNKTPGAKVLTPSNVFDAMAEVGLTDAANIEWNHNDGVDFTVTLADNRILDFPDNPKVGQKGRIRVVQDATGSRTLALGAGLETPDSEGVELSTDANAEDYLDYDTVTTGKIRVFQSLNWG